MQYHATYVSSNNNIIQYNTWFVEHSGHKQAANQEHWLALDRARLGCLIHTAADSYQITVLIAGRESQTIQLKMTLNTRRPALISPMSRFWGCAPRGLWPPNSNSAKIFEQCGYPPSFIILRLLVWKLLCWQTNTQADAAENIQRSSLHCDFGQLSNTYVPM